MNRKEKDMKNIKRMYNIINKIYKIWTSPQCRDWRFCQLYVNIFGTGDNFYVEDDIVEKKLDEFIETYGIK